MWIYFMKIKFQVYEMFFEFITWAEKQTGFKLKVYHIDDGNEFNNHQFQKYHKKHEIT